MAAGLSLTATVPNPSPVFSSRTTTSAPILRRHHLISAAAGSSRTATRPLRAAKFHSPPSPPPSGELYQPFRPPPAPLPQRYRALSTTDRIEVLRNRLGLWHEYAPIIPSLVQEGFTPPSIEEATGLTGVEQNRLVVAAQVRDSLLSSRVADDVLAFFDIGGAELLYEIRLLSGPQRAAAALYLFSGRVDPKAAQQIARSMKDFPRRRGEPGWECFSAASPADCLSFAEFRLSREAMAAADRVAALERALEMAETEKARERIAAELRKAGGSEVETVDEEAEKARLPVVRLKYGEVSEATSVAVVPVCDAAEGASGVAAAPNCRPEGALGVVAAEKGWRKWAVLPGWEPVMGVRHGGGVAVAFPDSRALPWRTKEWEEEGVLVVVDRARREVSGGVGFYLVSGEGGRLVVERGETLREKGLTEAVAAVVLVVRPPRDDFDDQIADEDWD